MNYYRLSMLHSALLLLHFFVSFCTLPDYYGIYRQIYLLLMIFKFHWSNGLVIRADY